MIHRLYLVYLFTVSSLFSFTLNRGRTAFFPVFSFDVNSPLVCYSHFVGFCSAAKFLHILSVKRQNQKGKHFGFYCVSITHLFLLPCIAIGIYLWSS